MDYIFLTGLIGSLILVTGAAWPETKTSHPVKSIKNWLFGIGGLIMLLYAIFGYQQGGPIFFVMLEILVVIASILMMLNTDDRIDTTIISISGLGLIVWSLYLFEGYSTVFFILGLSGIGLGYAFKMATFRRNLALTLGSILIALFSYVEKSWIFFWLNVFFAIFSLYYLTKPFMSSEKFFNGIIIYLKILTGIIFIASISGIITQSFDPSYFIEQNFAQAIFSQNIFPDYAKKAFVVGFNLFSVLSILVAVMQYYVIHYGLKKKEKWAFNSMLYCALIWFFVAGGTNLYYGYNFYIYYSVIPFTIVLLTPILLIKKYIK